MRQSGKLHLSRVQIWDGGLIIQSSDCWRAFWQDFQKSKNIFQCSHKLIIALWNWRLRFFSLYILAEEQFSMVGLRFSLPATYSSLPQSQSLKWRPHGWPCRKTKKTQMRYVYYTNLCSLLGVWWKLVHLLWFQMSGHLGFNHWNLSHYMPNPSNYFTSMSGIQAQEKL